jgi:hypothetical protein
MTSAPKKDLCKSPCPQEPHRQDQSLAWIIPEVNAAVKMTDLV